MNQLGFLGAELLQKRQGDLFEAFDHCVGFAKQFRWMRIGHCQALHTGAPRAADAFPGVFDNEAIAGANRNAVPLLEIEGGECF